MTWLARPHKSIHLLLRVLLTAMLIRGAAGPLLRNIAAVTTSQYMLHSSPREWLRPSRVARLISRSLDSGTGPVTAYRWMMDVYKRAGDLPQACSAARAGLASGSSESRTWLAVARCYVHSGQSHEAIDTLLKRLADYPTDRQAFDELRSVYRTQPLCTVTGHCSSSCSLPAGESARRDLWLPDTRPRRLDIECSSCQDSELLISINGIGMAPMGPDSGTGGHCLFTVFLPPAVYGDALELTLSTKGYRDGPLVIAAIRLEYVSNVEWYDDITNASWTDQSFKALGPRGEYSTMLYLPKSGLRSVYVNYYDFPQRGLVVAINGDEIARLHGEALPKLYGGWTPFVFSLSEDVGPLVEVTLRNPSAKEGTAIRMVALK